VEVEPSVDDGGPDRPVPAILMYHSIAPYEDDPYEITIRPEVFARHMRWLRRTGWRCTSVRELLEAQRTGTARRLVGLTFDDGYADFIDYALPVLQRHGFSATMFVPAGRLGGNNDWDPNGPRKPVLTVDQLLSLAEAGIEIGSHGVQHLSLPNSSVLDVASEIGYSRKILRDLIGDEVPGFCYPYGHIDQQSIDLVQEAGYSYACAVWPAELAGPFALPREYVRDTASARWLCRRVTRRWLKQEYSGPGAAALRGLSRAGRAQRAACSPAEATPTG
jgi:peptidoglycan/xylan/chitin deacetylase (PgdA/CDA1 family)